jgi:hypothetical protein
MRLKVKFEGKKGETIRKVFKGTSFNEFEEMDINNYHAINDIVVDRGPFSYSI